jgi:hypothetical protein
MICLEKKGIKQKYKNLGACRTAPVLLRALAALRFADEPVRIAWMVTERCRGKEAQKPPSVQTTGPLQQRQGKSRIFRFGVNGNILYTSPFPKNAITYQLSP